LGEAFDSNSGFASRNMPAKALANVPHKLLSDKRTPKKKAAAKSCGFDVGVVLLATHQLSSG